MHKPDYYWFKAGKRYHAFSLFLKKSFGCRVHKITLDAGFTCPTRDGTKGYGGCIYCNPYGSGTGAFKKGLSIKQQIENTKSYLKKRFKAKKFIAYLQAYSNTYADVNTLKRIYDEAVDDPDIVGLAIGTRPDCVNNEILDLIQSYTEKYQVWLEYGLQSMYNKTLEFIRRGHTVEDFLKAIELTKNRNILICVHIIMGLPGETKEMMLSTVKFLSSLPINGIKFHHLYIEKNTKLAQIYKQGLYTPLTQREYVDIIVTAIQYLRPDIVIQRLMGDPRREDLIAPDWSLRKTETINMIEKELEVKNLWQGKLYEN